MGEIHPLNLKQVKIHLYSFLMLEMYLLVKDMQHCFFAIFKLRYLKILTALVISMTGLEYTEKPSFLIPK